VSYETSKTLRFLTDTDKHNWFSGTGIDIGAGDDPHPLATFRFDKPNGDAHELPFAKESFDWIYSSHCLEHLERPVPALLNWWEKLKPNGFLVVTVPEFRLYENAQWPSRYNQDHKQFFTMGKLAAWLEGLPGAQIRSLVLHDDRYDYSPKVFDRTLDPQQMAQIFSVTQKRLHPFFT
jgi:SAM-dependent methyltransferase